MIANWIIFLIRIFLRISDEWMMNVFLRLRIQVIKKIGNLTIWFIRDGVTIVGKVLETMRKITHLPPLCILYKQFFPISITIIKHLNHRYSDEVRGIRIPRAWRRCHISVVPQASCVYNKKKLPYYKQTDEVFVLIQ